MKTKIMVPVCLVFLWILIFTACGSDNNVKTLVRNGARHFACGEYTAAAECYEKALKSQPENPLLYNLLGMAWRFRYNQTGEQHFKEMEIRAFRRAVKINPAFLAALKNLAASLYYSGNKQEAKKIVRQALELYPEDPEKELMLSWLEPDNSI